MKAFSIAVLALLGKVSASQINYKLSALYNHEEDTEDIPAGLDPIGLVQRGSANERIADEEHLQYMSTHMVAPDLDEELVQYDHENDTDDVPVGLDPIGFVQTKIENTLEESDSDSSSDDDAAFVGWLSHENDTEDLVTS